MPAKSKVQQEAMGAAYAAASGKMSPSKLRGSSRQMYESMSKKQLRDFAATKQKGLPERKKK